MRSGEYLLYDPAESFYSWTSGPSYYGKVYRRKGVMLVDLQDGYPAYLDYWTRSYSRSLVPLFPPTQESLEEMEQIIEDAKNAMKGRGLPGIGWQSEQEWLEDQREYVEKLEEVHERMRKEL